jgi:hypothetical protein
MESDSLTGITETLIHEPLRPAKDAAIHTAFRGDSKSLPNNRTAKVLLFLLIKGISEPLDLNIYNYLTNRCHPFSLTTLHMFLLFIRFG